MVIYIGDKNKLISSTNEVLILESNCQLKQIIDKDNILIILDPVIKEGLINNEIIIEELFLTLDLKIVFTNIENDYLNNSLSFYNVNKIIINTK